MLIATDWTVVGVILTAVFTGGIVIFTALAYQLGRQESRASRQTLYKLAFADLVGHWIRVTDTAPHFVALQLTLVFENKHPSDPIRYSIESCEVEAIDSDMALTGDVTDGGAGAGIIAPGHRDSFALSPMPAVLASHAPLNVFVTFSIKYGAARGHQDIGFEWRERRHLGVALSSPITDPGTRSLQYQLSSGRPGDVERLGKAPLRERIKGAF